MKKRMFFFSAMSLYASLSFAQFSGSGSGTESDPYLIMNATQLSQMSNFLGQEGVVFKLQKNIDLSSWIAEENPRQGWAPIGVSTEPFKGILIGNDKTISGLTITRSSESNVGFFGYLDGASIKDLTIEGTNLTGSSYLGTFAGQASNSTITNCQVKLTGGITAASGEYVGGFVGYASNSNFTNCFVEATVTSTGATFVGGFGGGAADETTINSSTAEVTVSSNAECVSGLLGYSKTVTITDTDVFGNVSGTSCVAGFIAKAEGTDNITSCTYRGDLVGDTNIGGISAYLAEGSSSMFTSCCTRGKITASGDYVGGIAGVSQGACIAGMESCSHFGNIGGKNYIGGIIGAIIEKRETAPSTFAHYRVQKATYYPKITYYNLGTFDEKLIIGDTYTKQLNNTISHGSLIGEEYVGGIVGYIGSSVNYITNQESARFEFGKDEGVNIYDAVTGELLYDIPNIQKGQYSKTLIYNIYTENLTEYAIIDNSFQGLIVGKDYVGGVTGFMSGGNISNCCVCAEMFCENIIGGIAGALQGRSLSTSQIKDIVFSKEQAYNGITEKRYKT